MPDGPYWLDGLMLGRTRREALKAMVAALAVLSLPSRPGLVDLGAANSLCQRGCLYYYNWTAYQAELDACVSSAEATGLARLVGEAALGATISTLAVFFTEAPNAVRAYMAGARVASGCHDRAVFNAKSHAWDCMQPGCPGFDPKVKGPAPGPCATCHDVCCPDPAVANGFSCCSMCHSSGGCCYSVKGSC